MQNKVIKIVQDYIKNNPLEYDIVIKQIATERDNKKFDTGKLQGDHALERHLGEMPEKIYVDVLNQLDGEEFAKFKQKQNQRWFYKRFPQFSVVKKI